MMPLRKPVVRLLAVFGLVLAFLVMASVLGPQWLLAGGSEASSYPTANPGPRNPASEVIGRLVGSEHEVVIYAGPDEPLYAVHLLDGARVAGPMRADELGRQFPELLPLLAGPDEAPTRMGIVDIDDWP